MSVKKPQPPPTRIIREGNINDKPITYPAPPLPKQNVKKDLTKSFTHINPPPETAPPKPIPPQNRDIKESDEYLGRAQATCMTGTNDSVSGKDWMIEFANYENQIEIRFFGEVQGKIYIQHPTQKNLVDLAVMFRKAAQSQKNRGPMA